MMKKDLTFLVYFHGTSTMAYSCDPNKRVALNKRVAWK